MRWHLEQEVPSDRVECLGNINLEEDTGSTLGVDHLA
jgi:hypothetical protein